MTPLLPAVSVGTIETRTVIESIRSLIGPRIQYMEAHCANVDLEKKMITCNSTGKKPVPPSKNDGKSTSVPLEYQNNASSRVIKDSGKEIIFQSSIF